MENRKRKLEQNSKSSNTNPNAIIIFVYIYGKITHKIFEIWRKSINEIKYINAIVLWDKAKLQNNEKVNYVVIDKDESTTESLSKLIDSNTKIVRKEWMIDTLKSKKLQPYQPYIIKPPAKNDTFIQSFPASSSSNISLSHRNVCNEISSAQSNQFIIDKFKKLENFYSSNNQAFKVMAYRKCCQILSKYPPIHSVEQLSELKKVPGIGKSMIGKIEEIITTGSIKKLDNYQSDPYQIAINNLEKIWGVGPHTAKILYNKGVKSVDELKSKSQEDLQLLLSESQLIGLKRFDDISQRIPRVEVKEIYDYISNIVENLIPGTICLCCGSYRRNKETCGDIDILLCPPVGYNTSKVLLFVLHKLVQTGFLTDHLAVPSYHYMTIFNMNDEYNINDLKSNNDNDENNNDDDDELDNIDDNNCDRNTQNNNENNEKCNKHQSHNTKDFVDHRRSYMGICKLPHYAVHRRIDIKAYSKRSFPFALLYFTGSDLFNRSMRLYCTKLNLKLSDKGLRHCIKGNNGEIVLGSFIPCQTENEIFKVLALDYKEPWKREGRIMKNGVEVN